MPPMKNSTMLTIPPMSKSPMSSSVMLPMTPRMPK
jgi:hypothetical protein